MGIKFRFKPIFLDARVKRFSLKLDDETVTYRHGPARASSHLWPFTDDPEASKVRLRFETSGNKLDRKFKGTWAFFRLLDRSNVRKTNNRDKYKVTFGIKTYSAKYELKASSVNNAFNLAELHAFRVPGKI